MIARVLLVAFLAESAFSPLFLGGLGVWFSLRSRKQKGGVWLLVLALLLFGVLVMWSLSLFHSLLVMGLSALAC
jgi:4-amino-4-deoxy-L-arabinose transferase-like glycosyltransferase